MIYNLIILSFQYNNHCMKSTFSFSDNVQMLEVITLDTHSIQIWHTNWPYTWNELPLLSNSKRKIMILKGLPSESTQLLLWLHYFNFRATIHSLQSISHWWIHWFIHSVIIEPNISNLNRHVTRMMWQGHIVCAQLMITADSHLLL